MSESRHDDLDFEDPLENYDPVEYSSALEQALAEECVTEITFQPFATVTPTTSIRDAIGQLRSQEISSLLVVEGQNLVGIFTERDVLEEVALQFSLLGDHPVSDVMTKDPFVVYETDAAGAALAAIAIAGYRHVPVVNTSGKLLGVVSPQRVFAFMAERM